MGIKRFKWTPAYFRKHGDRGKQIAFRYEVTSATDTISFPIRDDNNQPFISYKMKLVAGHSTGLLSTYVQFNNDGTLLNYRRRVWDGRPNNGTDQLIAGAFLTEAFISDRQQSTCTGFMYLKSGVYRQVYTKSMFKIDATQIDFVGDVGAVWYNDSDEVTSITFKSDQANGFGIGTVIELYNMESL